jgi:hypothetical protein
MSPWPLTMTFGIAPIRNQNFFVPIWIMSRHTAVKVLRDAGLSEPS